MKGNLKRFHAEGASSAIEEAASNYQSPSLIAVGADTQSVSILALVVNLILSLICLKAPAFVEKIGLTKQGALLLSLVNVFVWIPLLLAFTVFHDNISPYVFGALWVVNLIPAVLLSAQRENWLSSLIPKPIMGRYLGRRMAVKSAFYLGSFCALGILLDTFSGNSITGFFLVFFIALSAAFINLTVYWSMKDSSPVSVSVISSKQDHFGLTAFFRDIEKRKLSKFILFTSLLSVTISLCGPLYSVYILRDLGYSYLVFTAVIATEYLMRVLSVPVWGRMSDRYGNIRILRIVTKVIPFIPVFWLFCSAPAYFVFIQAMSGVCWGAYDLCTQNYLFKMAPPEKKLRYIMYNKSLTLFCMAIGGLLCVFLLREIVPLAGSRILSIFLLSGIFRWMVVASLIPKLVDFAVAPRPVQEQIVAFEDIAALPASETALYYQPHRWKHYSAGRRSSVPTKMQDTLSAKISDSCLYYHPERWSAYETGLKRMAVGRKEDAPRRYRGLYHDPAASNYFPVKQPVSVQVAGCSVERPPYHGLYGAYQNVATQVPAFNAVS